MKSGVDSSNRFNEMMLSGFIFKVHCSSMMYVYLDLSILVSIHLDQGVLPSVRHKIQSIAPVVLCLVLKFFLKVFDGIFR